MYVSTTPNRIYFESKILAMLYGCIVFIPLILMVSSELWQPNVDQVYVKTLTLFTVIFLILFVLFIRLYPVVSLELYDDHFVYKKGRKMISANWNKVTLIAFQSVRIRIPSSFVIRTEDSSTDLISANILKLKDDENYKLNLVDFVTDLENISGQKVKWGDVSINRFSEASFLDFLNGRGVISARVG